MPRQSQIVLSAIICLVMLLPLFAQRSISGIEAINKATAESNLKKADSLLANDVSAFVSAGNLDTLIHYIPLAGKIANKKDGPEKTKEMVYELILLLESKRASADLLLDAY